MKKLMNNVFWDNITIRRLRINGTDRYVYPSGKREFATTWCGTFNANETEYALLCVAFSKPTKANAPQRDIPELVAKGIMTRIK